MSSKDVATIRKTAALASAVLKYFVWSQNFTTQRVNLADASSLEPRVSSPLSTHFVHQLYHQHHYTSLHNQVLSSQ
ncbi:hypothetical protein KCU90_g92, partial [Aureobasidium melanogenum]